MFDPDIREYQPGLDRRYSQWTMLSQSVFNCDLCEYCYKLGRFVDKNHRGSYPHFGNWIMFNKKDL